MLNDYEIRGDITAIFVNSPKYGRKEVLISTSYLEKVNSHTGTWSVQWREKVKNFYCLTSRKKSGEKTSIYLHRYLMNCPKNFDVDHINHDTLDNTQENLRVVTRSQNMQNRKGVPENKKSSGVVGVSWNQRKRKWKVGLRVNGANKFFGYFNNIEEANGVALKARETHMPYSQEAM